MLDRFYNDYQMYFVTTSFSKIKLMKAPPIVPSDNIYNIHCLHQDYMRFYSFIKSSLTSHGKNSKLKFSPSAYAFLETKDKPHRDSAPKPLKSIAKPIIPNGANLFEVMKARSKYDLYNIIQNGKTLQDNPHFHAIYAFHPDTKIKLAEMISKNMLQQFWNDSDTRNTHTACDVQQIYPEDFIRVIQYAASELKGPAVTEENLTDFEIILPKSAND